MCYLFIKAPPEGTCPPSGSTFTGTCGDICTDNSSCYDGKICCYIDVCAVNICVNPLEEPGRSIVAAPCKCIHSEAFWRVWSVNMKKLFLLNWPSAEYLARIGADCVDIFSHWSVHAFSFSLTEILYGLETNRYAKKIQINWHFGKKNGSRNSILPDVTVTLW